MEVLKETAKVNATATSRHAESYAEATATKLTPFHCGIGRQKVLLMRQSAKEYPSFPLGNPLDIRLVIPTKLLEVLANVDRRDFLYLTQHFSVFSFEFHFVAFCYLMLKKSKHTKRNTTEKITELTNGGNANLQTTQDFFRIIQLGLNNCLVIGIWVLKRLTINIYEDDKLTYCKGVFRYEWRALYQSSAFSRTDLTVWTVLSD
ncbi:hypothetical protein P5673_032618 [Acropora cervicornis]|uniref:Uncharacterized protein n=1 Tax=Acropora cervicornis TaxID=6130 RepID=A0AAD9URM4_ACRCE|nr:hypothetical protein P5673_032618 [Acropora cervicornis]